MNGLSAFKTRAGRLSVSARAIAVKAAAFVVAILLGTVLVQPAAAAQTDQTLTEALATSDRVPVIVIFDLPEFAAGGLDGAAFNAAAESRIARQREIIERALGVSTATLAAPTAQGSPLRREYRSVAMVSMYLTEDEINALRADPAVSDIQLDRPVPPLSNGTIPLIGANTLHSAGLTGAGSTIAILDTGVDHEHPMFSGRILESACFSSTVSTDSTSLCPAGAASDTTAADAGDDCAYTGDTGTVIAGCGHGTHVAGIAAGASFVDPGTGDTLIGVAPGANIVAVQVFSNFTAYCAGFGLAVPCALSYSSDQIAALDWLYTNRATLGLTSINMSLGGGNNTTFCNADSRYTVINNLRTVGVATAIASGNSGYNNAVGAPGCIEPAITVGATDDSDVVASFSNSATMVDMLAPGVSVNSAEPTVNDTLPGRARSISGTSMATPHVAGAFALLRASNPSATVQDIETALENTGLSVTESPSSLVRPRIQVNLAHAALDTTPPRITSIERQTPSTSPTAADSVTWRVTFDEVVNYTPARAATSFGLTNVANVTDGGLLQLDNARSVTTAVVNGTTYLFAAGYLDDGVSVFSVANDGALTSVFNVSDAGSLELDGAYSVTTAVVNGTTYLFAAGSLDDGVSVFSVADNGALTNAFNVSDDATLELDGAYSVTTAVVNGTTYLFAAGSLDDGVSVFSVADNGALTNVFNVSDDATLELDSANSVTTAVVNGTTYLFAAGFIDDGVSVFSVTDNGALTNAFNVTDNATLELDGARSVTTAVVNGTTYLFAAGNEDHGVSVFSVADNGALTNAFNVSDDATLKLFAASSVTTAVVNGTTYLFAAGFADDGVSVFSVANDGALTNVANVSDDPTLAMDGTYSVTTAVVNGTTYLIAAGGIDDGVSVFSVTPPAATVANFTLAGSTATLTEATVSGTQVDVTASGGDLANLNATVTLGFAAGQTFADTAGNALANTTPTGTNDNTFALDNTAPTLAITGPAGPVSGEFTARLVFSEPITGFDISEIIVGNGSAKDLRAEFALPNGITASSAIPPATNFVVTITPTGDGAVTVDVAGAAATDAAGNGNTAATRFSVTADVTAPTVAIIGPAGPVNAAFTATVMFNEAVTGFTLADMIVGNGSASNLSGSGTTYTATITPTADGAVTVDVAGAAATDAAGNGNTAATRFSVTADVTAPTLAITGPAGPVAGAFTATVTFSEAVTGFVVGDITVGNGAASNFQTISASVYTATITPTADGAVTVDVAGAAATDAAGNASTAATQFSVTNDATAPTLAITGPAGLVSGAFTARITASEAVTGLDISEIIVSNGTASNLRAEFVFDNDVAGVSSIPPATNFVVTITPAGDGAVTVDVAGLAVQDAAGNGNTAATQFSVTNDQTAPTLAITGPPWQPVAGFTATFTFSEDVTGFTLGDIQVGNGTASNFQQVSLGCAQPDGDVSRIACDNVAGSQLVAASVYTATITPTTDGAVTVDVAGSVATDAAGNSNTAAAEFSVTADVTAPTLAITGPAGPVTGSFTATFTFSEDVTGFGLDDITVLRGYAWNALATSASEYTATITPSGDGAVTVNVAGAAATDAAGNTSTAAAQFSVTADLTAPTLAITGPAGPVSGEFTARLVFSEPITGFDISEIIVGNGSAKDLRAEFALPNGITASSAIPPATNFVVTITPASDGAVTVDVAGLAVQDAAGNGNTAATQFSVTNDATAPALNITGPAGPVSGAFTATFTFSEGVTGFVVGDITVGNGAASAFNDSAAPVYTATITPADDGSVTVDVAGSVATDAAGNGNAVATRFSVTSDATAPTLAITGTTGPVSGPFTATVTFDEDVAGFTLGDITVGNGAASAFDDSAAPVYTVTITPTADGAVTVDVAGAVATDEAGNDNTAATQFSVTNDETAPTLAITGPAGPVSGAFTATFTFDEDVTDFVVGDITVGNGAASGFQTTSASVYTATITPAADGAVTVDVAGAVATDAAGNDNTAVTQFSVTNDETAPTLAITGPAGPVSGAFTATFTFGEEVAGFALENIVVGNGAASNLLPFSPGCGMISGPVAAPCDAVSGPQALVSTAFTATITPAADGPVTLDVAGSVATDEAGNDNTAATQFSVTNDETAPTVASITRQTPSVSPTDADSLVWRVTFSETVVNAGAADFSVSGTTGTVTDVTDIDGATYDVTASGGDLANLNATVTLSFEAAQDIADEAGNTLSDTAPTGTDERAWSVINDAVAPTVVSILRDMEDEVTNADTLSWTMRFSEDVTDIDTGDFALSGTTGTVTSVSPLAVALPPSVTGDSLAVPFVVTSSAYTVTASGGDLASYNGVVTLSFAQGQNITDDAGNALTNTTPSGANENSYTLDNTAPTVSITTTATSPVSAAFPITITFSEDVTSFDETDITSGGGPNDFDAQDLVAVSASVYTATIYPGYGATLIIEVPAGAARDVAGNDNAAATPLSIAHDQDRTLTVTMPGVGAGTVTSSPAGVDCTSSCTADFTYASVVTLTATPEPGSSFAGWRAGDCREETATTCEVGLKRDATVTARFTLDNPPAGRIVAATLPAARSGYVGGPVISAFLSVVSRTSSPAQSCQVTAPAGAPVALGYNQLDTNGDPVGPDSPLFDIVSGGALNFVIGMTPTAQTAAGGYNFLPVITCENASLDPIVGVNSVFLTIGAAPAPDILSIAATPSGDGVIRIPAPGRVQFMTAAAVNVGIGDGSGAAGDVTLTTTVDTGAAVLPLSLEICQINAASVCITPRSSSGVTSTMTGSDPLFFAVFVRDTSTGGIPFDPANSRVFLRFADATGTIRSATSAAVTAPAPEAAPEIVSSLPQGRWSVLMRQPEGVWPGLARTSLYVTETGQVLIDDGISPRLTTIEAMAADNDADATQARFMALGHDGLWTSSGTIRLGAPWADTTGEFWGVRDARSDATTNWTDLAGPFGDTIVLSETGEIRGTINGCAVYGQTTGLATQGVSLILSGCAQSGPYLALIDLPANENDAPVLLIASGTRGWRVER